MTGLDSNAMYNTSTANVTKISIESETGDVPCYKSSTQMQNFGHI